MKTIRLKTAIFAALALMGFTNSAHAVLCFTTLADGVVIETNGRSALVRLIESLRLSEVYHRTELQMARANLFEHLREEEMLSWSTISKFNQFQSTLDVSDQNYDKAKEILRADPKGAALNEVQENMFLSGVVFFSQPAELAYLTAIHKPLDSVEAEVARENMVHHSQAWHGARGVLSLAERLLRESNADLRNLGGALEIERKIAALDKQLFELSKTVLSAELHAKIEQAARALVIVRKEQGNDREAIRAKRREFIRILSAQPLFAKNIGDQEHRISQHSTVEALMAFAMGLIEGDQHIAVQALAKQRQLAVMTVELLKMNP